MSKLRKLKISSLLRAPQEEVIAAIAEIDAASDRIKGMELKVHYTREEILADIEKIVIMPHNNIQVKFKFFIDETKVKVDQPLVTIKYET